MTLRDLSDADLNRWLAERLADTSHSGASDVGYEWNQDWNRGHGRMQAKDFIHDPAMLKLALGQKGFVSLYFMEDDDNVTMLYFAEFCGNTRHGACYGNFHSVKNPDLQRAVMEAWALSLGWKES